jgi:hypothetical protein
VKKNYLGGACTRHGKLKNTYKILVGKLGWKIALGTLNIDRKMILDWISDLKEM